MDLYFLELNKSDDQCLVPAPEQQPETSASHESYNLDSVEIIDNDEKFSIEDESNTLEFIEIISN